MNFSSIRLRNQQNLLENILCDEKKWKQKESAKKNQFIVMRLLMTSTLE